MSKKYEHRVEAKKLQFFCLFFAARLGEKKVVTKHQLPAHPWCSLLHVSQVCVFNWPFGAIYVTRGVSPSSLWARPETPRVVCVHGWRLPRHAKDEACVKYKLRFAMNSQFDVFEHGRRRVPRILQDVKDLRLDDRYSQWARSSTASLPYDDEHANLRFVDPHEWISMVYERIGRPQKARTARHASQGPATTSGADSTRTHPAYTELLVDYSRRD